MDRTRAAGVFHRGSESQIASLPTATPSAPAALPRDSLVFMTSDALDEWQKRLQAARTLSADDKKELQRQRRLVKNRESAQLSRQRKKGYIGQLELRLTELSRAHDELTAKVCASLRVFVWVTITRFASTHH
jgi:hypothetical protein